MSVFLPWQAGPRHLAHHCGLIQWLAHSRCLVNTSRWKNASYPFITGPSAGGLPCNPGCLGCSEGVGRGVAWGGKAALQGQTPYLQRPPSSNPPPHPIGLFSVRVWTSPTSFIGCPHPPPARQVTGTLPAGIQQALAAALSERQVGGICVFPLPLCCLLPYHMEVQAWFLEIPGLSHGPSVGRREPSCHSLAGTTSHLWGCVVAMGFFFHFMNQRGLPGTPVWFCPSPVPLTQSQFQTSPGHDPKGAVQTGAWRTS